MVDVLLAGRVHEEVDRLCKVRLPLRPLGRRVARRQDHKVVHLRRRTHTLLRPRHRVGRHVEGREALGREALPHTGKHVRLVVERGAHVARRRSLVAEEGRRQHNQALCIRQHPVLSLERHDARVVEAQAERLRAGVAHNVDGARRGHLRRTAGHGLPVVEARQPRGKRLVRATRAGAVHGGGVVGRRRLLRDVDDDGAGTARHGGCRRLQHRRAGAERHEAGSLHRSVCFQKLRVLVEWSGAWEEFLRDLGGDAAGERGLAVGGGGLASGMGEGV